MTSLQDYILGLDFDGVLWDSAGECFLCARETLVGDFGQDVPAEGPVREAFRRGRWLARTGGDFLLIYELAAQDPQRDFEAFTKDEFHQLRLHNRDRLAAFELKFYANRERLRLTESSRWLASQEPFDQVVAQFSQLRETFKEVVLMTTKDGPSARHLLASASIEMPIWSRENGVDKGDQVLDLCHRRQHKPDKVMFIDDLVDNLDQVARVGAVGFLADWGYNTASERSAAQHKGYNVLGANDLVGQIRGHCHNHTHSL